LPKDDETAFEKSCVVFLQSEPGEQREEAFSQIYTRLYEVCIKRCRRMTISDDDARDAASEALARLFKTPPAISGEGVRARSLMGYARTIARNCMIDNIHARRRALPGGAATPPAEIRLRAAEERGRVAEGDAAPRRQKIRAQEDFPSIHRALSGGAPVNAGRRAEARFDLAAFRRLLQNDGSDSLLCTFDAMVQNPDLTATEFAVLLGTTTSAWYTRKSRLINFLVRNSSC